MIDLCPECGTYLDRDANCPNCKVVSIPASEIDALFPEHECTFPKELIDHLREKHND